MCLQASPQRVGIGVYITHLRGNARFPCPSFPSRLNGKPFRIRQPPVRNGQTEQQPQCVGQRFLGADRYKRFQRQCLHAHLVGQNFAFSKRHVIQQDQHLLHRHILHLKRVTSQSIPALRQPLNSNKRRADDRSYLGYYKGTGQEIANGVPQLITQELFDRVAIRRNRNKRAPSAMKSKEKYYCIKVLLRQILLLQMRHP